MACFASPIEDTVWGSDHHALVTVVVGTRRHVVVLRSPATVIRRCALAPRPRATVIRPCALAPRPRATVIRPCTLAPRRRATVVETGKHGVDNQRTASTSACTA